MVNELYPFDGKYIELGDLSYHYLDEGAGDPVVMLHGNPTWSFYYRNLVLALRDSWRCIVPDHIGCGYSDKPGDDKYEYTLERRVDDLEALLDHLGITENITLVLHDWGGMIGMAYATRHPERIRRFVIMNTSAFSLPKNKPFPWPLWLVRNTAFGAFLVRRFNAFSAIASAVCVKQPLDPAISAMYRMPYDSWDNRIATLRFVQDIPLRPGDKSYPIVREVEEHVQQFANHPMLICWGMKDFVFSHHFLDLWTAHFPRARVHRFDRCGHYVLEDAKIEIISLVRDFLKST